MTLRPPLVVVLSHSLCVRVCVCVPFAKFAGVRAENRYFSPPTITPPPFSNGIALGHRQHVCRVRCAGADGAPRLAVAVPEPGRSELLRVAGEAALDGRVGK